MYPASIITSAKLRRLADAKLVDMREFARAMTISSKSSPSNKWVNWRIWFTPKVLSSLKSLLETGHGLAPSWSDADKQRMAAVGRRS